MKLKHKISLLVIGILLVVSILISSSYALWVFNVSQESTNVVQSDCFEITFSDNNPIELGASFPMRDSDGVQTTPYTFTIRNICNHPADFQINLETLNTSTIDESFIKADLNGHITLYSDAESVTPTLESASSAIKLYEDTLGQNTSKTYNLRIWLKEDAVQSEVENKSYNSKVTIVSTLRKEYAEGTLIKGEAFNVALKTLAGDSNPTYYSYNTSITSIERSLVAPSEDDNVVNLAATGTTTPIYAWFKDGTIYIYSTLDKIYMNSNSAYMFYKMKNVAAMDLSTFDTSNVTNMSYMFYNDSSLVNLDLSNFDTSNVTNMSLMFSATSSLTSLDVSNFDTSKVTNMSGMFDGMSSLTSLDVSNFNTSNVTNMSYMFDGMRGLTSLDVSNFDTSNVTSMKLMFSGSGTDIEQQMKLQHIYGLENFDTSNVVNMSGMFGYCGSLKELKISNFDTSKVTDMSNMFSGWYNNNVGFITTLDLSNFDTSNVENMSDMFSWSNKVENIIFGENFDTSNVTNMSYMFFGMSGLKSLDVSNFDTSNVENMSYMFYNMRSLTTIYVGNAFDTSKVTSSSSMFTSSTYLVGSAGTTYNSNHTDKEYARVDDPANGKPGYFTLKTN